MNLLGTVALAAGLSIAGSSAALATDLYTAVPSAPAYTSEGADWQGFYLGVFKTFYAEPSDSDYAIGKGLSAGLNFVSGNLLFGVEVKGYFLAFTPLNDIDEWLVDGEGRIGVLANPSTLIYASAGGGAVVAGGSVSYGLLGAGVEFRGDGDASWEAEYQTKIYGGGFFGHLFTLGANWQF